MNDQMGLLKRKTLEDKIEKSFILINPTIEPEEHQQIKEYKELVSKLYVNDDLEKHKGEVFESSQNQEVSKEKIKRLWVDLTGLTSSIKTTRKEFEEIREKHTLVNERLKILNKPYNIPEVKSFENLMSAVNESTEVRNLINFNQRFVSVLKNADRIGIQQTANFAKNSLALMEKRGFNEGIKVVLKGVLNGGVKAGATGATSAGAAGGLATVQAIPVVGQVILVGAVLITSVKIVYKKIISPIIKGIKSIFNYMGADLDSFSLGAKKTFEDILGRFFGGVTDIGFKIALGIVAIPTIISSMSFGAIVAPVVIFVIVGLFGYQFYNSNIISSLVPPRRLGGEISDVQSLPVDSMPEDCPSIWPTTYGCITQGPQTTGTHSGYEAIDIGCIAFASSIYATHSGLAVPFWHGGCGYGVNLYSTCNGTKFYTRYCHFPYHVLKESTQVKKGQVIGKVNDTGLSWGNHIHYDLKLLGKINDYLPKRVKEGCTSLASCGYIYIKSFND